MVKLLVHILLLVVLVVQLARAFIGGGPGKRSSLDANRFNNQQQERQQVIDTFELYSDVNIMLFPNSQLFYLQLLYEEHAKLSFIFCQKLVQEATFSHVAFV